MPKRRTRGDARTVLAYLCDLKNEDAAAASSLWTLESMISSLMERVYNVKVLAVLPNLKSLLKNWAKQEEPRKAKTFEKNEIYNFLKEAPNEYLPRKVSTILAVFGLLRRCEVVAFEFRHIELQQTSAKVSVYRHKQAGAKHQSSFLITDTVALEVMHKYYACYMPVSPQERTRRFLRKLRASDNTATRQIIGYHKIAEYSTDIARFLGRSDVKKFSCHSFRRTGATILAEYMEDTDTSREQIARALSDTTPTEDAHDTTSYLGKVLAKKYCTAQAVLARARLVTFTPLGFDKPL
eukprot:gene26662-32218_t